MSKHQIIGATGVPVGGFGARYETSRFDRRPFDEAAATVIYAAETDIPVDANRTTGFLYVVTSTLRDGVAI